MVYMPTDQRALSVHEYHYQHTIIALLLTIIIIY